MIGRGSCAGPSYKEISWSCPHSLGDLGPERSPRCKCWAKAMRQLANSNPRKSHLGVHASAGIGCSPPATQCAQEGRMCTHLSQTQSQTRVPCLSAHLDLSAIAPSGTWCSDLSISAWEAGGTGGVGP